MTQLRLGLLRLTDAAPVALAQAEGLFAREGLDVALHVEPSWANVADKLAFGRLDGAVMLPPLALAMHLGLRAPEVRLAVPMSLSLNGNHVVLARGLADEIGAPAPAGAGSALDRARRLRALLPGRPRLRLAVVHAWSGHDLLLRYWLAAGGIDPARDLTITVLPPSGMVDAMASGAIDGFCAGAPWGAVAEGAGAGRIVVATAEIWRNHPEKCLALRGDWAEAEPAALQALLRALLRACRMCDAPERAAPLAALLARPEWVGVPAALIAEARPGSTFFAHAATVPWRSHARWFAGQMARWRTLPHDAAARAELAYRPELHADAARALGLPVPRADRKAEGAHAAPWLLPADPAPIPMEPDLFCDGAVVRTQDAA